MGGAVSTGENNDELIDKLKNANYIKTPHIERVFRLVDRADYITLEDKHTAYRDSAWRNGNLHLSAPCIYARALEGLEIDEGMSFLNIGSGTGYLSTMVGLLLGPRGLSHGVELHSDVVDYAYERLEWFKTNSGALDVLEFCEPTFIHGNAFCLPDDKPLYDRVYCGAACHKSHENYMKNLLKVGGILVMPLNEELLKITRLGIAEWEMDSLLPVTFSPLVTPDFDHPPSTLAIPPTPFISLQDLCRKEIRKILHIIIEEEDPNLKNIFYHEPCCRNARQYDSSEPNSEQEEDNLNPEVPIMRRHRRSFTRTLDDIFRTNMRTSSINSRGSEWARILDPFSAPEPSDERSVMDVDNGSDVDLGNLSDASVSSDDDHNTDNGRKTNSNVIKYEDVIDNDYTEVEPLSLQGTSNPDAKSADNFPSRSGEILPAISGTSKSLNREEQELDNLSSVSSSSSSSNKRMRESESNKELGEPKKREKFDSGVGDELDDAGSSSDDSSYNTEGDELREISWNDSDYDGRTIKVIKMFHNADYRAGSRCVCKLKKKVKKREGDETEADKSESTKKVPKDDPCQIYSSRMREKIRALPLPLPIQVYINNNRSM